MSGFEETKNVWQQFTERPFWHSILETPYVAKNPSTELQEAFWVSGKKDIEKIESIAQSIGTSIKNKDVLDYGCGMGRCISAIYSLDPHSITGADVCQDILLTAHKAHLPSDKLRWMVIHDNDISKNLLLPGETGYEVIICLRTLYHMRLELMLYTIRSLLDILKPGGVAFLHIIYDLEGYTLRKPTDPITDIEIHPISIAELNTVISSANCEAKVVTNAYDWSARGIKNCIVTLSKKLT